MLLDLLGQILPSFHIRYRSKTLLELLGPVPLHFFNKSLPNFMENAPGASWTNSSLFLLDPFQILLETIHKAPWANSFAFLHWTLTLNQWKYFLSLLSQILQVFLSNPYQKSTENAPGAPPIPLLSFSNLYAKSLMESVLGACWVHSFKFSR